MRVLKKMLSEWVAYRRAYNELAALTDRELNDIGVGRGYIATAARTGAK